MKQILIMKTNKIVLICYISVAKNKTYTKDYSFVYKKTELYFLYMILTDKKENGET